MDIYFSDFFDVHESVLDEYGAFNISLINDLPVFIDPFLLFNSENPTYQQLHEEIIQYMRFLKAVAAQGETDRNLIKNWFTFKEVKQNWLGYSKTGNKGRGLGLKFARSLHTNLHTVFRDFGDEFITQNSHLEKLCLIRGGVGRDNISDFTTNLIKGYLAKYTQTFAQLHLREDQRRKVQLPKAAFNYDTQSWAVREFELPWIRNDYVLLTPRGILTKDEAFINHTELVARFQEVVDALPDQQLRAQLDQHLLRALSNDRDSTKEEVEEAITRAIERFPQVLDFYILEKEENKDLAGPAAAARVSEVEAALITSVREFVGSFLEPAGFYRTPGDSYREARARVGYLKDVIENKGGHRVFFDKKGNPFRRESDLQLFFRLTWYAADSDISSEVNDGRGPVDFKASQGAGDKTLVEFKLASNGKLKRNLEKQVEVYEKASDATNPSLKVIVYFTEGELRTVRGILEELNMDDNPNVILIDAREDNKPSGSNA